MAEARSVAEVRPLAGGFVVAAAPAGAEVRPGGPAVLQLDDPARRAERDAAAVEHEAAGVRRRAAAGGPPALTAALADREAVLADRLAELDRRLAGFSLHAGGSGVWITTDPHLGPGAWLPAGADAGVVADLGRLRARLVADQHLGPRLLASLRPGDRVSVRTPAGTADARVLEVAPAGSTRLPSAALTLAGGGEVAGSLVADADAAGDRSLEPVFEVLVELDATPAAERLVPGTRVRGVFPLAAEPAGVSLLRWVRQLLLKR